MTSESAAQQLQQIGRRVLAADAERLEAYIAMGRLLITIQAEESYRGEPMNYPTWQAFLNDGFHKWTGLGRRTAYTYIDYGKSKILEAMTPEARAVVAHLGNAGDLVRLEKTGGATPAVVEQARTLPRDKFQEATGASSGVLVRKWLANVPAGKALQRVVNILAGASADALGALADVLEKPETMAYAVSFSDLVDVLTATITQEMAEQLALMDPLDVLIFQRQGWRCAHCKKRRPLQKHHELFKSHGGTDAPDNLRGLCWACHPMPHGLKPTKHHTEQPIQVLQ